MEKKIKVEIICFAPQPQPTQLQLVSDLIAKHFPAKVTSVQQWKDVFKIEIFDFNENDYQSLKHAALELRQLDTHILQAIEVEYKQII